MLRNTSDMRGFTLGARDGDIGRVKDFYFDDESWTVRYLVVDTGSWLTGRQVLISPLAIQRARAEEKRLEVGLTKAQIEASPRIEEHKPVSRQYEEEYHRYYNFPYYWQGPDMWGALPRTGEGYGQVTGPVPQSSPPSGQPRPSGDPHLRSTQDVKAYAIEARNGEIGHVEDFVIDDTDWVIEYLVVDTRNWWPGKKVLVSPAWATSVDWHRSTVHLDLEREAIKSAPEYEVHKPITREYESRLFNHYNRKPYWTERMAA